MRHKILFVCLGNICRSPLAEGILRNKALDHGLDIEVDSCGTAGYHIGEQPDPRSIAKAKEYGIDISMLRGRKFSKSDFDTFDRILVMDKSNYADVIDLAKDSNHQSKVEMVLNIGQKSNYLNVPDPYYGGEDGFQEVYDLLDKACDLIIEQCKNGNI